MEGLNKNKKTKIDSKFENLKKEIENKNRRETHEYLANKFSELISNNPIVIYSDFGKKELRSFSKIKEVRIDESGTGGQISVNFSYDDYVSVRPRGFGASSYFERKNDYYKISKESLSNIIRMMRELIWRSGYSETDKAKMYQSVLDNFKDKIIQEENIEKNNRLKDSTEDLDQIDPDYIELKE